MITTLKIQNFKCDRQVTLERLGRINLLLGKNNSGKTALLEALFFLSLPSNPKDVLTQMNEQRGYRPDETAEEAWGSLFHNWDTSQDIRIETIEEHGTRMLRISPLRGGRRIQSSSAVIESGELDGAVHGLVFDSKSLEGDVITRQVTSLKTARRAADVAKGGQRVGFVYARGIPTPNDEAKRYSQLDARKQSRQVDEALKIIEPRINYLKVLTTEKGGMLYGDLGGAHLMPLPLMGDGLLRALSIASTMVINQGGLVLIDEVENGLHYSVQHDLWRLIAQMARKLDVQVFAATHSNECTHYALKAMESLQDEDNLRAYRFDLVEGRTRVVDYSASELAAAIQSEQEYR